MNLSQIYQMIEKFPLAFAGVTIMALLVLSAVLYKSLRHRAKSRLKGDSYQPHR